jgi:ribulose bisphosphate carboxylase small subunit
MIKWHNDNIPQWLDKASTRLRYCLYNQLMDGYLPDLEKETVRKVTKQYWLRIPNFGRKTYEELIELVGDIPNNDDNIYQRLDFIETKLKNALQDIIALKIKFQRI